MYDDSVFISNHSDTLDGLRLMLEAAIGPHEWVHSFVAVEIAMLIVEAAKRAPEDRPEWFPRGRWATIQEIETEINRALATMFEDTP